MTEQELDRIRHRVLLDSMKAEAEQAGEDQGPSFEPTARHKRQMRAMLEDPRRWLRRRERPLWRRAAQRAAVILLMCILAFGGVMAFSPAARAGVIRWVMERYGNRIDFVYSGEQNREALPEYGIAELPEGYVEKERYAAPGNVSVIYEDQNEDFIYLTYNYMHQGAQIYFTLNGDDVSDIMVGQMKGQFLESHVPGNSNCLTWIDEDKNIQFILDGNWGAVDLLHMAESVSLCKTPN